MSPSPFSKSARHKSDDDNTADISDVNSGDDDKVITAPVLVTVADHVEDDVNDDTIEEEAVEEEAVEAVDAVPEVTEQVAVAEPVVEPVVAPTPEPKPDPVVAPTPVAAVAPEPASKPKRKWRRTFFRWFVRLLVVSAIAAGAYFAWPTINERYIQPVETTAADLSTVQDRLGTTDDLVTDLGTRLDAVEASQLSVAERLDGLDVSTLDQAARLDEIDTLIADQTTRLDALDELAATLGTDLDDTNAAASRQLGVTRATELMSRSRLFLYQSNYGLAVADLTDARATLASLEIDDPIIADVIDRLDRAIANLPAFPVAAAADVDIAWQSLLGPAPVARTLATVPPAGATTDNSATTDSSATSGSTTTNTTAGG